MSYCASEKTDVYCCEQPHEEQDISTSERTLTRPCSQSQGRTQAQTLNVLYSQHTTNHASACPSLSPPPAPHLRPRSCRWRASQRQSRCVSASCQPRGTTGRWWRHRSGVCGSGLKVRGCGGLNMSRSHHSSAATQSFSTNQAHTRPTATQLVCSGHAAVAM